MPTGDQSGDGWHPAQSASYQSDFGDAGGSALTRGPAHARVGRVIAPSAPSLTHSSALRAPERSSCPGADAGGRAPAKPRALTPTRPRVRVPALSVLAPGCVRRRWCSRTPFVNRARAPRAPTKCIFPEFFFPCADGWSRSRSRQLSLPVRVPGKKLTDRRRWPTVIQNEVLILTRDIMFLQRYRPKSACYWCLSSCD